MCFSYLEVRPFERWQAICSPLRVLAYETCMARKSANMPYLACRVNVCSRTESGHLSAVPSSHLGDDWEYFTLHDYCTVEFESVGDGSFHAVVLVSDMTE